MENKGLSSLAPSDTWGDRLKLVSCSTMMTKGPGLNLPMMAGRATRTSMHGADWDSLLGGHFISKGGQKKKKHTHNRQTDEAVVSGHV